MNRVGGLIFYNPVYKQSVRCFVYYLRSLLIERLSDVLETRRWVGLKKKKKKNTTKYNSIHEYSKRFEKYRHYSLTYSPENIGLIFRSGN